MMTKPERKRHREKRRRDRVNASFDELRALLIRIDPQCSNRVDISQLELIDRSIIVIKGLLQEIHRNRDMLRQVNTFEQQGNDTTTKTLSSSVGGNFTVPFVNPFENESQQQTLSMSQQLREAQSTSSAGSIFGAAAQQQQQQQEQQHAAMQASQDQHAAAVHQLLSVAGGGDSSSSHGVVGSSLVGHTAQQLLVSGIIPNTTAAGTQQQLHPPSTFGNIQSMQSQQSTYNPQQHPAPAPPSDQQHDAGTTMNMWTAFSAPIDPDAPAPPSAPV